MAKILKNTTVSDIPLSDCGLVIAASSSVTTNPGDHYLLSQSTVIDTYIDSGAIVVNDGYDDLKPVNGKRHIHEEGINRPSAYIATASVVATTNSTFTLDSSSRLLFIFTGTTAGQIIKLGDARTYNIGHKYEIWNSSTQSITVQNNSGTSIFLLAAQQKTWINLQDNSTQAGVWLIEANFMGGTGGGNGTICFGFDGNASTGRWLESLTNVASNLTPCTIAGTKAIRSLSLASYGSSTITVTLLKNGVALETITLSAQNKNSKLNLNHILVDKDQLSAQVTSGSCARPVFVVWL